MGNSSAPFSQAADRSLASPTSRGCSEALCKPSVHADASDWDCTWLGVRMPALKMSIATPTSAGCATQVPSWPSLTSRCLSAFTCDGAEISDA